VVQRRRRADVHYDVRAEGKNLPAVPGGSVQSAQDQEVTLRSFSSAKLQFIDILGGDQAAQVGGSFKGHGMVNATFEYNFDLME
jgi:hypothetical protein